MTELTVRGYATGAKKAWSSSQETSIQITDATFGLIGAVGRYMEISRRVDSNLKSQLLRRELGDALCYISVLADLQNLGGLYEVAVTNLIRISGGNPLAEEK